MRTWLYIVKPPRATFLDDATLVEQEAVRKHFAYLEHLTTERIVWMAGRCDDARFGLVVFEAADEPGARAVMQRDPAVAEGVFAAELIPFGVALWKPDPPRT